MEKETILIREQVERTKNKEHSVPLYMTSSYKFDSAEHMAALFNEEEEGFIYSRYSNPNVDEFVAKMAQLENTETAWATATGMAAVFTGLSAFLVAGDRILSCRSIFGSTHKLFTSIFPKWNIHTDYVDLKSPEKWEDAIGPKTKILYLETPTNPGLDIVDLELAGRIAKKHNLIYAVDNCFATCLNQNPADFGADLIIHSATKFIDGQGRGLGGVICGSKEHIKTIEGLARHTGPAISPYNAWTFSKSLETLAVRVEKHNQNALEIARRLENLAGIKWVKYPFLPSHPQYDIAKKQMKGGGGLVTFEIEGGIENGRKFLNALQLFSLTANLGDVRSIATHPASTTHSKLTEEERLSVGITPGLIRLSIGLEHIEDIWKDIEQAIKA